MKKSELKQLIKECILEINIKQKKQPISAQLGVLMSDGSVETIRILTGGSNIETILKDNYSTQKQLQSLLDYGDIFKLKTTPGNTIFAERDKKMKHVGARLKENLKSFCAMAKANKAKRVYLFDLVKKEWIIVSNAKIDTLLNVK